MKQLFFTSLWLLCSFSLFSQMGSVSGTIIDEASAEPLIGANIVIEGTGIGSSTDFDGKYQFKSDPGTYTLVVSYVGYQDKKVEGVEVKSGENNFLNITMSDDAVQLVEVVVQAKAIERTENALLLLQKKSDKIQDGISSQEMSRYGSGDAASALTKVTGTSVVDGKYVYVRGLGDRYSTSQINGIQLPSSDPYRNSAQLDIIPTNLLENIITSKTFTPDLPGNFTGGNVNVQLKSLPEQLTLKVSGSLGYNTLGTLQDEFLGFDAGNTAWLGFNDGTLDRPAILEEEGIREFITGNPARNARRDDEFAAVLDDAINGFNTQFEPEQEQSGLNRSLSISFGNQFHINKDQALGVLFTASYSNTFQHIQNGFRANYQNTGSEDNETLTNNFELAENTSAENPTLGGLLGLSYKFNARNSIFANVIYNHNTTIQSRVLAGTYFDFDIRGEEVFTSRVLGFTERQLVNYLFGGEHSFAGLNNAKLEYTLSLANSIQNEPDLRFFASEFDPERERYAISPSNYTEPSHFFRELNDNQIQGKIDFTIPFLQTMSKGNKLKFGGNFFNKTRDFEELIYAEAYNFNNQFFFDGDAATYFREDNRGVIDQAENGNNVVGLYLLDQTRTENSYDGETNIYAGYGMATINILDKLKFIGGLRIETTDIYVESRDSFLPEERRIAEIDTIDILPSINLIYSLTDDINIRFAYTNTLARPNMREVAPFANFGFIGDPPVTGNPDLVRSRINNFDLRFEYFLKPGEMFAVSGFYKLFRNPIVRTFRPASNPELTWVNTSDANVYGVEFEFRKSLGFISPVLEKLKFSTNLSLINSSISLDSTELAINREVDPEFPEKRELQGQSPFVLNAILNYVDAETGVDASLAYNVFGDRLYATGIEGTPDVYERARGQLDLIVSKKFNNKYTVKLRALNLLDPDYLTSAEFKGNEYTFSRFRRGRTFVVGFSYDIY